MNPQRINLLRLSDLHKVISPIGQILFHKKYTLALFPWTLKEKMFVPELQEALSRIVATRVGGGLIH